MSRIAVEDHLRSCHTKHVSESAAYAVPGFSRWTGYGSTMDSVRVRSLVVEAVESSAELMASQIGHEAMARKCSSLAAQLTERLAVEPGDRLVGALGGRMLTLDDFCRTRLIEVFLHLDDLVSVNRAQPLTRRVLPSSSTFSAESRGMFTATGALPMHGACRGANGNVFSCVLTESARAVSRRVALTVLDPDRTEVRTCDGLQSAVQTGWASRTAPI